MSDYETDSEVNELSRTSGQDKEVPLSPDLWEILWKSQEISRRSHGAFDVTIGPCTALWRKARREKKLPDPERLERARARVGYTNLLLRPRNHSANLLAPNMQLDLGGIAKGYAADEALKTLRSLGITSAFVAASGDIALGDAPPGQPGWRIGIAGYDAPGGPRQMDVYLKNCGISTSGDASQRLDINGTRYSHILNPFTGLGLTNHSLATVIAPTCTISDTLDTTLCIVEPKEGLALAKKYHAKARIVRETSTGLETVASPGFDRMVRVKAVRKRD
jgi:thiamine biosynthesis lipoprotein